MSQTQTTASPVDRVVSDFTRLQSAFVACVHAADGLPLDRVTVQSPFDTRIAVNLYSALALVPRHQHRHLHQAEQAAACYAPRASAVTV